MNDTSAFDIFPKTHIQPYDGMSVTADVWAEAHSEHRKTQQAHDVVFHGSGIITGLEVTANDPADQYVFISPGVAVDPAGNVIVLNEPVAYDFGNAVEGDLFLLLGHGEREVGGVQKEIRYAQDEFVVAARSSLPKRPSVELARVTLSTRGSPIKNAADPAHPAAQEIDLRYRLMTGPLPRRIVRVGICEAGGSVPGAAAGWEHLARECMRSTPYQLVIDSGLEVTGSLQNYALVYLCADAAFKVDAAGVRSLADFLAQGGALLAEACSETAEKSFKPVLDKLEVKLAPVGAGHALLEEPYLFSAPPAGEVTAGARLIYSTGSSSLSWSGRGLARAEIRSAHEWGVNLVHYLLKG